MRRRKKPAINQKNVDKYITEGLLNRYRFMAETEVVRVPPVIYNLLVFAGELEELREELVASNCCGAEFDNVYLQELLLCPQCHNHCGLEITPVKIVKSKQIAVGDQHWLDNDYSIKRISI